MWDLGQGLFFLPADVQLPQHHWLKIHFLHGTASVPVRNPLGSSWESLLCSTHLCVPPPINTTQSGWLWFYKTDFPHFSLFHTVLASLAPLLFYKLQNVCVGILTGIASDLCIDFERTGISTTHCRRIEMQVICVHPCLLQPCLTHLLVLGGVF